MKLCKYPIRGYTDGKVSWLDCDKPACMQLRLLKDASVWVCAEHYDGAIMGWRRCAATDWVLCPTGYTFRERLHLNGEL